MSKVTILLATFNRAHLIQETLASILAQTHTNWECIIVDDYSTDDTKAVVADYIEKDSRFHYYLKTNTYKKGLSGTRNCSLDIAKERRAEYIQFFDDDDIMHPRKLELQVEPFLKDQSLGLTLCKYEGFKVQEELKDMKISSDIPILTQNLAEDFLFNKIRINSAGPLFKAHLFNVERFDESLPYGEERECFLRLFFKYRPKYAAVSEYLFFYRHHPISITARRDNKIEKIGVNIITHQRLWDYLYEHNLLNRRVTAYFLRQFLLQNHNKTYLRKVDRFLSEEKISLFHEQKFRLIMAAHSTYSRIIHKLMMS